MQHFRWCFLTMTLISIAAAAPPTLNDLSFITGHYRAEQGGLTTEEFWTDAAGGLMLGTARAVKGDKAVFFEFLRIEQRPDGIFYVAQPRGKPPTDFKLTSCDNGKAVFENPKHDFPTKITYERVGQDTVRASVSGPKNGKEVGESWEYQRVK